MHSEFIRQAVKEAIRRREYEEIREAYVQQPDSPDDADDWANADEWTPSRAPVEPRRCLRGPE